MSYEIKSQRQEFRTLFSLKNYYRTFKLRTGQKLPISTDIGYSYDINRVIHNESFGSIIGAQIIEKDKKINLISVQNPLFENNADKELSLKTLNFLLSLSNSFGIFRLVFTANINYTFYETPVVQFGITRSLIPGTEYYNDYFTFLIDSGAGMIIKEKLK